MPRIVPLSTLVLRAARRADKSPDPHISDAVIEGREAEWQALLGEKYGELHAAISEVWPDYFRATSTITATGAVSYPEPADLHSLTRVDFLVEGLSSRRRRPLRLLAPGSRALWAGQVGEARHYLALGREIALLPAPSSGLYEVTYVPQPPDLAGASPSLAVDVITADGEAYLVWGAAALALAKSERDVRFAERSAERALERVSIWAARRGLEGVRQPVADPDLLDEEDGSED